MMAPRWFPSVCLAIAEKTLRRTGSYCGQKFGSALNDDSARSMQKSHPAQSQRDLCSCHSQWLLSGLHHLAQPGGCGGGGGD